MADTLDIAALKEEQAKEDLAEQEAAKNGGAGGGAGAGAANEEEATKAKLEEERLAKEKEEAAKNGGAGGTDEATKAKLEEERLAKEKEEAAKNGGAAPDEAAKAKLEEERLAKEKEITTKATADLLKKLGVNTIEEALDKLKKPDAPEVVAKKAEDYKSAVDAFAVKNNFIKRDEIITLENMRKAEPQDIAYGAFSKEYLEKNKDATPDQIKQEFDLFYHVNNDNAVLKDKGQEAMKRIAESTIGALDKKLADAKVSYDKVNEERAKVPEFKVLVQGVLKSAVPEKMQLHKEGESEPITFDITQADIDEVEKFLVSNDNFLEFLENGSGQPTQQSLKDKAEGYLKLKYWDKAMKTVFDAGRSVGTATGSDAGAKAAFELKQKEEAVLLDEKNLTKEDTDKIGSVFGGGR